MFNDNSRTDMKFKKKQVNAYRNWPKRSLICPLFTLTRVHLWNLWFNYDSNAPTSSSIYMILKSTQGQCSSNVSVVCLFLLPKVWWKKTLFFKLLMKVFFLCGTSGWWFEKFYVQWIKKMVVVDLSAELKWNHKNWHKKATAQSSRRL